ncbi:hypothetical protein DYB32_001852 [Aphanomyces invadans]|uniref:Uncharacterized protein n=1 Tax=Aphanomyces invadans TaxID=157072 RepID=A0A3R6YDT0_9STRA|nr:hypothetical protein DYB32_001852 [Aphanomyces invadans]
MPTRGIATLVLISFWERDPCAKDSRIPIKMPNGKSGDPSMSWTRRVDGLDESATMPKRRPKFHKAIVSFTAGTETSSLDDSTALSDVLGRAFRQSHNFNFTKLATSMRRKHIGYSAFHKKQIATNATIRRQTVKPYEHAPVRVESMTEVETRATARRLVGMLKSKDVFRRDASDKLDLYTVGFYELENVEEIGQDHLAMLSKYANHLKKGTAAKRLHRKALQWKDEQRVMGTLGFAPGRLASSLTHKEIACLMNLLEAPLKSKRYGITVQTSEQAQRVVQRNRRVWETWSGLNNCCWDTIGQNKSHRVKWRSEYARAEWADEDDYDSATDDLDDSDAATLRAHSPELSLFDYVVEAMPESPDLDEAYDYCDIDKRDQEAQAVERVCVMM